jgi:hypothetical protein
VRGRPVGTLVGRGSRTSSNKNRAKGASTPKGGTGSIILPSRLSVIGSRNGAAASITARHALDVFESTSGEPPLDAAHGVRSLGSVALPKIPGGRTRKRGSAPRVSTVQFGRYFLGQKASSYGYLPLRPPELVLPAER